MELTLKQLKAIMPESRYAAGYLPFLNKWMKWYGITTLQRICHFIAQVAHESAQLNYSREIGTGHAYDVGKLAERLGNTPEDDGDGERYKGRGLIQVTGLANYKAVAKDWDLDVVKNPELLEQPDGAARSACWFWWKVGLNKKADQGASVKAITKIINGGYNGLAEREAFYKRSIEVLQ